MPSSQARPRAGAQAAWPRRPQRHVPRAAAHQRRAPGLRRLQVFKDPYLFDFLGTDAPRRGAELEQGLVAHIQKFLLELGQGLAFVGRQVQLEIGEDDFYLDLLFHHLKLRRYVVIELKARKFQPGEGAQLGVYMTGTARLKCLR